MDQARSVTSWFSACIIAVILWPTATVVIQCTRAGRWEGGDRCVFSHFPPYFSSYELSRYHFFLNSNLIKIHFLVNHLKSLLLQNVNIVFKNIIYQFIKWSYYCWYSCPNYLVTLSGCTLDLFLEKEKNNFKTFNIFLKFNFNHEHKFLCSL